MLLKRPVAWSEAMKRREFGEIADWFIFFFFYGGGIGLVVAGLAAAFEEFALHHVWGGFAQGLRIFVLSSLFGAASTISGWLLGLLFGIPRSLARANVTVAAGGATAAAAAVGRSSRVNTNLEDISDWLTKTIVGVGLTQLFSVPHYLWSAAYQLNAFGFSWGTHGRLLALTLFLYFAPGGFWLGYVGTRTILTKLLEEIDSEVLDAATEPKNLLLRNAGKGIAGPADPQIANADRVILGRTLQELTTTREIAAWGAAQARSGNLAAAQTALASALQAEPNNPEVKELAAIVHSALGEHAAAANLLRDLPPIDLTVFNALYESPPGGFARAIAVGENLLTRPEQQSNANLRVWMACAYGQKYRYERDTNNAPQPILDPIRQNVLREIRAALAADPNMRPLLHALWRPVPADSSENDLAAFSADDPELTALLGGTPTAATMTATPQPEIAAAPSTVEYYLSQAIGASEL
jgi:hypothetical protein